MQTNQPLSNLQLELLKVFSRDIPDDDLRAIKELLSNYFAQKAVHLADSVWEQEGFSEEQTNGWQQMHLRTAYKGHQKGRPQS